MPFPDQTASQAMEQLEFAKTCAEGYGVPGLQDRLRGLARHGLLSVFSYLSRPPAAPALRLLYCHHVFDDERAGFAAAIDSLAAIGDFVGTPDVVRILAGKQKISRHTFHLSFDDGSKNILTNALPVLRERSIPAIIFVPTAVISNPQKFPDLQRVHSRARKKFEHATWSDLERASMQGMEIGSHTRTHACLSKISWSSQLLQDEVAGSRVEMQRILGNCDYMSWPYGGAEHIDARALTAIQGAGYLASFGAFRGRVVPGVTDRFQIPRHHFEPHWPLGHIRYFAQGGCEA